MCDIAQEGYYNHSIGRQRDKEANVRKNTYTGKYNLTKNEFLSAYYYAMRYHEWKDKYDSLADNLGAIGYDGLPKGNTLGNPTEKIGSMMVDIKAKVDKIEQTVMETDKSLYQYILKAVTNEGITYNYLQTVMNIPCSRGTFYDRRRKFYYLLSQKIK